jgi:hypothetical protein
MSPDDYMVISAAVVAFAIVAAASSWKPPKKSTEGPRETTRWKRFRIRPAALHGPLPEPSTAVTEEPSGLKLQVAARQSPGAGKIRAFAGDGKTRIDVVRRGWFFSRGLRLKLGNRHWLDVDVPRGEPGKLGLRFPVPSEALQIRGSPADREYEILKEGRLVATVSWQRGGGDKSAPKEYFLETIKGQDPLPLVALVLAVEVALG